MRFICLLLIVVYLTDVEAGYYKRYWRKNWKPKCDPVKCEEGCVEEIGPNNCPTCVCVPICPEMKCPPDCIFKKLPDSPCPTCECIKKEEEDIDDLDQVDLGRKKPACSPPKCPPGCEIEEEFEGPCPECKCFDGVSAEIALEDKPLCSDPKCPPGCELEQDFDGPCPGCKCKDMEKPDFPGGRNQNRWQRPHAKGVVCAVSKCESGCEKVDVDEKGCPVCECKPKCDEPKCDSDCELVEDLKGPCMVCLCKEVEKEEEIEEKVGMKKKTEDDMDEDCPALKEECKKPQCSLAVDEKGCDVCKCGPVCVPPKCPRRCKIETIGDKCPECVCPKFRYG